MKLIRKIKNKQTILYAVFFVLFFLSYTANILQISESSLFAGFERQPEGLVVGRLARSAQDGVFSYGGLNGINYDSSKGRSWDQHTKDLAAQHDIYITNTKLPDSYQAYKSQTGGQGIIFSIMHKFLSFDNAKKLMTYRAINALLVAFIFLLFGAWVYRNYGFTASLVTLLLILFSPWLNMFAHNLWWVLWNFYLPFLTMLFALEHRRKHPNKMTDAKLLVLLFIAVFIKCFFSGFEFITTTLVAAVCPIVYYAIKEEKTFIQFVILSIKVSIAAVTAAFVQMLFLITQIKVVDGTFTDGFNHIISSFTKRSEFGVDDVQMSFSELFKLYLQNDAFQLGFLSNDTPFYFGILIIIILCAAIALYFKNKENTALLVTTAFSMLAPLSWLIIFKQHSVNHIHMDYIIWYMPFLLYGFCIIGVCISSLLDRKK